MISIHLYVLMYDSLPMMAHEAYILHITQKDPSNIHNYSKNKISYLCPTVYDCNGVVYKLLGNSTKRKNVCAKLLCKKML